jgi:hypothetical protein
VKHLSGALICGKLLAMSLNIGAVFEASVASFVKRIYKSGLITVNTMPGNYHILLSIMRKQL